MRLVGGHRASATVLVAALSLVGCSDSQEPGEGSRTPVPVSEDSTDVSPLEEALDLLPRDVGLVDFSSDRHSADRLGLVDEDASTLTERGTAYADRVDDVDPSDLAAISSLAEWVEEMTEGGATFSQVDVRWSMRAAVGEGNLDDDGRSVEAFRLVDGIDMADVVADVEDAGFARSTEGGWEMFHLEGQLSESVDVLDGNTVDGRFPETFFPDVAVHPETHLVALGDVDVLDTDDSEEPLTELEPYLPAATGDVERFALTAGAFFNCYAAVDAATGNRTTPDRFAAWWKRFGIRDLGTPGATMLTWVPGEDVVHRSFFADEASAQRALQAREKVYSGGALESANYLGVLMPGEGNESPYEPGWQMTREGNVVTVLHNATAPEKAILTYGRHGVGFDTCLP